MFKNRIFRLINQNKNIISPVEKQQFFIICRRQQTLLDFDFNLCSDIYDSYVFNAVRYESISLYGLFITVIVVFVATLVHVDQWGALVFLQNIAVNNTIIFCVFC